MTHQIWHTGVIHVKDSIELPAVKTLTKRDCMLAHVKFRSAVQLMNVLSVSYTDSDVKVLMGK